MVSCVNDAHGSFTYKRKVRDLPDSQGWFDEYSTHCMERFGSIKKKYLSMACVFSVWLY